MKFTYSIIFIVHLLPTIFVSGQAGSLDPTFGFAGVQQTHPGLVDNKASSVAIQSDGKIVVAGKTNVSFSDLNFTIVRYNQNGSLDPTFDGDGIVITNIQNNDCITGIAIQSDDKILVAGSSENGSYTDVALARYNADGTLDPSFDGDGIAITTLNNVNHKPKSIVIQQDGKIIVAGHFSLMAGSYDIFAYRFNSDGSPDSTYNGDGRFTLDLDPSQDDYGNGSTLQPDGKLIICGYREELPLVAPILIRVKIDGTLDSTFNSDGIFDPPFLIDQQGFNSINLQQDGKVVASGFNNFGGDYDFMAMRLNSDGTIDNSFNSDGVFVGTINESNINCVSTSIQVQNDGKLILSGKWSFDFLVIRLDQNGEYDSSFDLDGFASTDFFGEVDSAFASAIQSDGKIILAGSSEAYLSSSFTVARYNGCSNSSNTISLNACDSIEVNSQVFNSSGIFFQTIPNSSGCDSIITLDIHIDTIDITVSQNLNILSANQNSASYQWINCSTLLPIPGATNQSFTATQNGDYAVIISELSCIDTSSCLTVFNVGLEKETAFIDLYPNPTEGLIKVYSSELISSLNITSITGNLVYSLFNINENSLIVNLSLLPKGIYICEVIRPSGKNVQRFIKL